MTTYDWERRYESRQTPWDLGAPHPELAARLAREDPAVTPRRERRRALVPGCGRAHDAIALARAGWQVTAVDLVASLRGEIQAALAPSGGRFLAMDALALRTTPAWDLLFDHTFFCALPPERRAEYGPWARRVVAVGGRLVALVFPIDRPVDLGGPPFPMTTDDLAGALGRRFRQRFDEPVEHPGAGREWGERWAVFERTG